MSIKSNNTVVGVRFMLTVFLASLTVSVLAATGITQTVHAAGGTATWVDANTIQITAGPDNGNKFSKTSTSGSDMTLTDQSTGQCGTSQDTLDVNPYQSASTATLSQYTGDPTVSCQSQDTTITITTPYPGGSGTSGNSGDTCPIDEGNLLRWVLCPVYDMGIVLIKGLMVAIGNFLYTPTSQIFGTGAPVTIGTGSTTVQENPDIHGVFDAFRNIALALLVVAGLVMVIAQAANLEIFAAYTVRKALPRIVIAAIGISLAWPIMQFVVTFFDDLGVWTGTIILSLTHVTTGSAPAGFNFEIIWNAIVAVILSVIVALGAVVILGAGGLMSLLGTVLLAALVGLIVLAIRQLVILLCIVLAPLAIASSVLPGTRKLWDFWEDTLMGALLMYPLIMGFLASGAAMAGIAAAAAAAPGASPGSSFTWNLLAVLVFFAPLFFLPFMFKIASGLMGGIHSAVNGRFQGAFKSLSDARHQASATNRDKLLAGRRFRGNKGITGLINSGGKNVGAFMNTEDKLGFLGNKDARDTAKARWGTIAKNRYAKEEGTGATMYWDDMLHAQKYRDAIEARAKLGQERGWFQTEKLDDGQEAATYTDANGVKQHALKGTDGNYYTARRGADGKWVAGMTNADGSAAQDIGRNRFTVDTARVNKAIQQANAQGGFGFAQQQYAIDQLAANGTGYDDMQDALTSIAIASNGNKEVISNMVGGVRSLTERAGRLDVKGNFVKMVDIASDISENNNAVSASTAGKIQEQVVDAVRSADNATFVRQKPKAVANGVNALAADLEAKLKIVNDPNVAHDSAQWTDASADVGRIRAKLENMVSSAKMGYGPEVNQERINLLMNSAGYDQLNGQMNTIMQPRPTQPTNPVGQTINIRGGNPVPGAAGAAPAPQPAPGAAGAAPAPQPVFVPHPGGQYQQQVTPVQVVGPQGQPIASMPQQQPRITAAPPNAPAAEAYENNVQMRGRYGDQNDPRNPQLGRDDDH